MRPPRTELKFLVHHSVCATLLERWRPYLTRAPFTNRFGVTPILSQYYDSPALDFYHEKLAGVGVRNKVRLRTYGFRFCSGQATFLEIKQRFNDPVRKVRYRIPDYREELLDPSNWTFTDPSAESAFGVLNERYRLCRSAQVFYLREAYEGIMDCELRVTCDTNLIGLHPRERLTRDVLDAGSRSLMADSLVILEVKSCKRMPGWVLDGVCAAELQHQSVPKYITAVESLGMIDTIPIGAYV